jgi:Flp pilus assembly protein TadD
MKTGKCVAKFGVVLVVAAAMGLFGCARPPEAKMAKFMESGKKLAAQKDYKAAILQFRNAAQVKPKDPEPYYRAGLAYVGIQDWADAVPSLRKALALNPKHTGAQLALA